MCPRSISDTCYIGHDGWSNADFTLNNVGYYGVLPVAVFELFFGQEQGVGLGFDGEVDGGGDVAGGKLGGFADVWMIVVRTVQWRGGERRMYRLVSVRERGLRIGL